MAPSAFCTQPSGGAPARSLRLAAVASDVDVDVDVDVEPRVPREPLPREGRSIAEGGVPRLWSPGRELREAHGCHHESQSGFLQCSVPAPFRHCCEWAGRRRGW